MPTYHFINTDFNKKNTFFLLLSSFFPPFKQHNPPTQSFPVPPLNKHQKNNIIGFNIVNVCVYVCELWTCP